MAIGNMHTKFGKVWLCSTRVTQVDRQTKRQTNGYTHHNNSHLSWGEVTITAVATTATIIAAAATLLLYYKCKKL